MQLSQRCTDIRNNTDERSRADLRSARAARGSGSQSLERGLDILEMIEAEGGDVGVRELAPQLGLSPTIVQRLISSLAMRGYIEKNSETSRYRLGHRSMILGASGERGVDYAVDRAALSSTGWHTSIISNGFVSVLRGGRAIYLLAVQADGPVAIKVSPGSEMPLHSTSARQGAAGRARRRRGAQACGQRKLAAITPHTITDPATLSRRWPRCGARAIATVRRGEHSRRAVGRRADPRSRRQRRGRAERGLSQVSRRRPDACRRRCPW